MTLITDRWGQASYRSSSWREKNPRPPPLFERLAPHAVSHSCQNDSGGKCGTTCCTMSSALPKPQPDLVQIGCGPDPPPERRRLHQHAPPTRHHHPPGCIRPQPPWPRRRASLASSPPPPVMRRRGALSSPLSFDGKGVATATGVGSSGGLRERGGGMASRVREEGDLRRCSGGERPGNFSVRLL
jgi:hypothetical protein